MPSVLISMFTPAVVLAVSSWSLVACAAEPIPNRIVVLTFDDAVKSHYTVVRPLLLQHGFGATFFITEGFDFAANKADYLTWEEIGQLHRDGFEIGNHTRDHAAVTPDQLPQLAEQVESISQRCLQYGIPRPVSFAYPGNAFHLEAFPILTAAGIRFARRGTEPERPYEVGNGFAYEPGLDHPLLIPSVGDARPHWTLDDFRCAAEKGMAGRIAVLQFHGVPDRAHPWVHTAPENFTQFMQFLADQRYTVIALRDLARYVEPGSEPTDPEMVIRDRQHVIATDLPYSAARAPRDDEDLRYWLENMFVHHHFTFAEMTAATGLAEDTLRDAVERWKLDRVAVEPRPADAPLRVLPYPGGRHPRHGFRDGQIRPQRDTKFSVFTPWDADDYVVLDIPEAIWFQTASGPQLLYLAHTHIPTFWDQQRVPLPPLEWTRGPAGRLSMERRLPNGIVFSARIQPAPVCVRMEMTITNGTNETLSGLRVQNCVMPRHAEGFHQQTNDNKTFRSPYAVCRNEDGTRWIITAWHPCQNCWGNDRCPCLHSDPQFPDCAAGATQRIAGWLSFYAGTDIDAELARIDASGWRDQPVR